MASFPDIPVDIVREILEHLACIADPSRFNVSLVSRTVQQWTDPYVLDRIIIRSNEKWDEFAAMLQAENLAPRMKQAFLFLRIFAVVSRIGTKLQHMTMDQLLQLFPRLEIIYASPTGSQSMHHPHAALRRIGAAFGITWLRGIQSADDFCHWNITHLDLVPMRPEEWSDLVNLGLPTLNTLTHVCCDLEVPSTISDIHTHLQVLATALPPSLLLCLVNIHFEDVQIGDLEERYEVGLDDRILLCSRSGSDNWNSGDMGPWILAADLMNDFEEWNGAVIEKETYWSRGLDMVKLRRAENS
ncbi:hypothetical protein DL96DRAFT_904968 [Flagelloscypha sp. PMI_526]|nr:hypothetical protein DL96DRAFT_904968 [Flagelloscypha sp. PMI_526]